MPSPPFLPPSLPPSLGGLAAEQDGGGQFYRLGHARGYAAEGARGDYGGVSVGGDAGVDCHGRVGARVGRATGMCFVRVFVFVSFVFLIFCLPFGERKERAGGYKRFASGADEMLIATVCGKGRCLCGR